MTKFRDIHQAQMFDFIGPDHYIAFCVKISARRYRDRKGKIHRVQSINLPVFAREVEFFKKNS